MSGKSLRLRLLLAAAISIAVALGIAGLGLVLLFERYVERRVEEELKSHLLQLAAAIKVSDGRIVVSRELADPRFSRPLSGLYWQIDADGTHVARAPKRSTSISCMALKEVSCFRKSAWPLSRSMARTSRSS
jgi:hypothetical protein